MREQGTASSTSSPSKPPILLPCTTSVLVWGPSCYTLFGCLFSLARRQHPILALASIPANGTGPAGVWRARPLPDLARRYVRVLYHQSLLPYGHFPPNSPHLTSLQLSCLLRYSFPRQLSLDDLFAYLLYLSCLFYFPQLCSPC